MVFHWRLGDSKSPQVFRILLSIWADPNYAVVWMVSNCPLISKSSCPFINPLVTVPSAPITTGITVTFMFRSFFSSQARSWYLSFFSLSFRRKMKVRKMKVSEKKDNYLNLAWGLKQLRNMKVTPYEFFTPVLAVLSGQQDFPEYSNQSYAPHSSSDLQFAPSLFHVLRDLCKSSN